MPTGEFHRPNERQDVQVGEQPVEMNASEARAALKAMSEGNLELLETMHETTPVDQLRFDPKELDQAKRSCVDALLGRGDLDGLINFLNVFPIERAVVLDAASKEQAERLCLQDLPNVLGRSRGERNRLFQTLGISEELLHAPEAVRGMEVFFSGAARKGVLQGPRELLQAEPWIRSEPWFDAVAHDAWNEEILSQERKDPWKLYALESLFGSPTDVSPEQTVKLQESAKTAFERKQIQTLYALKKTFGVVPTDEIRQAVLSGDEMPLRLFGTLLGKETVDAFKEDGSGDRVAATFQGRTELTDFYRQRKNYDGLKLAIDLGVADAPFSDPAQAEAEAHRLLRRGDALEAEALVSCYGLGGTLFDAGLRERIRKAATEERGRRERGENRELDTGEHDLQSDLATFYFDQRVSAELVRMENRLEANGGELRLKLPVSVRRELADLRSSVAADTDAQFSWMREYLARHVAEECRDNQSAASSGLSAWTSVDVPFEMDAFLTSSTDEQIRGLIRQVDARFGEDGWTGATGGKQWEKIAQVAEDMFAENGNRANLVDVAYDLQHNTGSAFNKEPERIQFKKFKVQEMLDIKRYVHGADAYLEVMRNYIPQKTYATLLGRWEATQTVRNAVNRYDNGNFENIRATTIRRAEEESKEWLNAGMPDENVLYERMERFSDDQIMEAMYPASAESMQMIIKRLESTIAEKVREGSGKERTMPLLAGLLNVRHAFEQVVAESRAARRIVDERRLWPWEEPVPELSLPKESIPEVEQLIAGLSS